MGKKQEEHPNITAGVMFLSQYSFSIILSACSSCFVLQKRNLSNQFQHEARRKEREMIHRRSIEALAGSRLARLDNMQVQEGGEVVNPSQAVLTPLIRPERCNRTEEALVHAH